MKLSGTTTYPRVLRTPFVDQWNARRDEARRSGARLREEMLDAVRDGRGHELIPFTGQSAGLIHDVPTVEEILRRMMSEAEEALRSAGMQVGQRV